VLAAESGVSRALLSKLEAGGGNPSLETMWRLARAFDIALSSLLGEDELPAVRFIPAGEGTTFRSEGGLSARLVLAEGRVPHDDLVKVTIHMKDVDQWATMNAVYETFFDTYLPARMTMQSPPPLGFLVDIDAIAYLPAG
jgi:transcriptional regulator with XRE-family HTH domain